MVQVPASCRWSRRLAVFIGLAGALVAGVALADVGAGANAPATGPSAEEARILADAARLEVRFAEQGVLHGDADLDRYLLKLADRLVLADTGAETGADPPASIRIRAVGLPAPLALSLANGAVYLSIGLIACLDDESQLALVVGSEISRVLSREDYRWVQEASDRERRSVLPALLSALVLGAADQALDRKDDEQRRAFNARLDAEADAAGLAALLKAGWSPASVPALFSNVAGLAPILVREPAGNFGDPARLEGRRVALVAAVEALPPAARAGGQPPSPDFTAARRGVLLAVARLEADVGRIPAALQVLDRRDAVAGQDGQGAFLRATLLRRTARSPADREAALAALVAATGHEDVPVEAFRELGFVHRRTGNAELASQAFAEYLKRSPDAIDAAIVRGYIDGAAP